MDYPRVRCRRYSNVVSGAFPAAEQPAHWRVPKMNDATFFILLQVGSVSGDHGGWRNL